MKRAILVFAKIVAFIGAVIVFCIVAWLILFSAIKPSALDSEEANGISTFVATHYPFAKKSKSNPDKFPCFCIPGQSGLLYSPPHKLKIYTVIEKQQQDGLLRLVEEYKRQNNLRPIIVEFFEEENWTVKELADDSVLGFRGNEEPIRIEKVK